MQKLLFVLGDRFATTTRNLLLCLLIVAAAVGSRNLKASVLSDAAIALQPGQWVQLQTNQTSDIFRSCDGTNPIISYTDVLNYSATAQTIYFFGEAHGTCSPVQKAVKYYIASNTWSVLSWAGVDPARHAYDQNALHESTQRFFHRNYGTDTAHQLNISTGQWIADLPTIGLPYSGTTAIGLVSFPERNSLIAIGDSGGPNYIREFSFATGLWSQLGTADTGNPGTSHRAITAKYNSFDHSVWFSSGLNSNRTWKLDTGGAITRLTDSPFNINSAESKAVADPASGVILVRSINATFWRYDGAWTQLANTPLVGNYDKMAVAALPDHGVSFWVNCGNGFPCSVWLYKHTASGPPPPDTTPPLISAINSTPAPNTATIGWSTNEASDSQIDYGLTAGYGASTTLNSSLVTAHSQALLGLTSNVLYHYRVKSKDAAGNLAIGPDSTFSTPLCSCN